MPIIIGSVGFGVKSVRCSIKTIDSGQQWVYNSLNQLTSKPYHSYGYDNNGNNTTVDNVQVNWWDSQNRLISRVYDGHTSQFTYGADGLRRSMTEGGTTTRFVIEGQSVVRELRGGQKHATYFMDPNGYTGYKIQHSPTGDIIRWYVFDGLGSVVAEVDEDGKVNPDAQGNETRLRKYDVYGVSRNVGLTGDSLSNHKFVGNLGHSCENETGLIYMRARYYDPTLGRFISEDPAKDGINWYAYCANNPINGHDPTGKFLSLLMSELVGLEQEGSEGAAANVVKKWGTDKIYQAVAKHAGYISGYLAATTLTDLASGVISTAGSAGIYIKNTKGGQQIFLDFDVGLKSHHGGKMHIDFQPDNIGGVKYERIFIQNFLEGFRNGL